MNDQISVYTISGVASAAGVPECTIRDWARRGLIPHTRDSTGRRLFDSAAIEAASKLRADRRGVRTSHD